MVVCSAFALNALYSADLAVRDNWFQKLGSSFVRIRIQAQIGTPVSTKGGVPGVGSDLWRFPERIFEVKAPCDRAAL